VENLTFCIAWLELIKVNPLIWVLRFYVLTYLKNSVQWHFMFYISEAMVVGQPIEVFPS
jgi:hypothetical protein